MYIKHFEDLVVYQIALRLAKEIHTITGKIPFYWRNKDIRQIRASSSSVSANIAEGFANRFYPKKFVYYLSIAHGSSEESKDHLEKLDNDGYLNTGVAQHYLDQYKDLSVRLVNFIAYLRKRQKISTHQ